MATITQSSSGSVTRQGREKRAYQRHPVDLKGYIFSQDNRSYAVDIRDFCQGGMYLTYSASAGTGAGIYPHTAPAANDIIQIRFTLPGAHAREIRFNARVARSDLGSLGVAFIDAPLDELQKVLDYAIRYNARPTDVTAAPPPANPQKILEGVRRQAVKVGEVLVDTYLLRQSKLLMELSDKSRDITEQNAYFEAMESFRKNKDIFKAAFKSRLQEILAAPPEPMQETIDTTEHIPPSTLSLVDNDDIEDWITRSDITHKVESMFQNELSAIEQRLSILYGLSIGKDNNPIGPEAFSLAFQDALKQLPVGKTAYGACCKIFRDVLNEELGIFYEAINKALIEHNVSPELHYQIKMQDSIPRREEKPSSTGGGQAGNGTGGIPADSGNLYDLISGIRSIKQQHVREKGEPAEVTTTQARYSIDELVHRLSDLALPATGIGMEAAPKGSVQSSTTQLLQRLRESNEIHRLAPREETILETTGSIYDALLNDRQITHGAKSWLSQVEMPLLKEALNDESVLADKSHIARKFINQLARLELYNDERRDFVSNAIKTTIEDLLRQVSQQSGMDEALMASLLKKVNALVTTQDKAYNANLSEVVDQCNARATLPKLTVSEVTIPADEEMLREWRKRIRRLNVGDWFLFNADSAESNRLRLAWISDSYDDYVFVNLRGLLEGAIGIDDLARQLVNGTVFVLDDANEPAIDRAQYAMLHDLHSQLVHETTHDHLTGLINRREFDNQLKKMLVEAPPEGPSIVCFLDIDYFHVINSTFGMEAGDRVLVDVSHILESVLGDRGILARVGSNKFAYFLPNATLEDALHLNEQHKEAVSQYQFVHDNYTTTVTFCTGILPVEPGTHETPRLVQTAEAACRIAKSKGINCTHVLKSDDVAIQEAENIMQWAAKIDDALAHNNLHLQYQPITPIVDNQLDPHAEILLRISDDTGQLSSPEPFILAAEHYKRMPVIDRWIISNLFQYVSENPVVLDLTGQLSINLSGLSINDDSFPAFILEQLEKYNVPPAMICFEVTETAGISNLSNATQFIKEIKKSGCSFSLDDFGTGMSSYAYLKNLPVDYIKIDGSFVRNIETNESDMAVVKSVTEIGHFMGKKIIAECVENERIIQILRNIGVDYGQGYAISKPKPLTF